jgi:nucleoside-diphosphate-sugar epimerase
LLAFQYFQVDGLNSIRARIFNTTGPRKNNDVCASFTRRVVELEKNSGHANQLIVGNLHTRRAICDVRDLVVALDMLACRGKSGEAYNICGSKVYKIVEVVEIIRKYAKVEFSTKVDTKLLRPTDEPIIVGSSDKLVALTGWEQKYSLDETIHDMLEWWRRN